MKTKIITFSILVTLLFSPALNCAFAGDAFSQLQGASFSPNTTFDGSKSYFSKISPTAVKSAATTKAIKDAGDPPPEPKPSLWEKTRKTINEQKTNITMTGIGAGVGFLLGGPVGALIGAGAFIFIILLVNA